MKCAGKRTGQPARGKCSDAMNTQTRKQPLDLVETAQKMLDAAVAVTTGRLHLTSPGQSVGLLGDGDRLAVYYFRIELARQISGALLMMDPRVVAVFEDRHASGDIALDESIRLWVQVKYRTAALNTVIDALNQALGQAYSGMFDLSPANAIETIILDDRDSRLLQAGIARLSPAPILLAQRS